MVRQLYNTRKRAKGQRKHELINKSRPCVAKKARLEGTGMTMGHEHMEDNVEIVFSADFVRAEAHGGVGG